MAQKHQIVVTSHVARDFLQNAAYFSTLPKLVWEYVSNSLDAARDDIPPTVDVEISSHEVRVADNGRGMSRDELNRFFQMHGENIHRKEGRRVRGIFGTGKCAAFGMANYLRITTMQGGLLNSVELHRRDIQAASHGKAFPVKDIIVNRPTDSESGTIVEIHEFNVRRLDIESVISYVQRQLSRYHTGAAVWVNGQRCIYQEPPSIQEIQKVPPPSLAAQIDECSLTIKVSPIPLDEDTRGIAIYSNGIWHETTLAGLERREKANQLFGEIDVPLLESGEWLIPPFDNTRNNQLNRQNPVVVDLLSWIAEELEKVRLELVEEDKKRKSSELSKQLSREAKQISKLLNDDFHQLQQELELSRKASRRGGPTAVSEVEGPEGQLMPGGGDEPTPWEQTGAPHGDGKRGPMAGEGNVTRPGPGIQPGNEPGTRRAVEDGRAKRRSSAFSIEFENATLEQPRSRYDAESKTIFINLDHPQVSNSLASGGGKTDSASFRETVYEIAAVEYAIALPFERYNRGDSLDVSETLKEMRDTINRITRRFSIVLYERA